MPSAPSLNPQATVFVPDGLPWATAVARTTHLGIGAHQDDLEFMALHGILACYGRGDRWFGGVICTAGGGSARTGPYAGYADEALAAIRHREQEVAAVVGQYAFVAQLGYPSAAVRDPGATAANGPLAADLEHLLRAAKPAVVYTHNPADKHETHLAVVAATVAAARALPPADRPRQVLGCEGWRDLDWLPDANKVVLDVGGRDHLATALNGVFDSQIAGGKRYDLAVLGRRRANATFFASHAADTLEQAWLAMDLTPLIQDDTLDPAAYVDGFVGRFAADVRARWGRYWQDRGKAD